MNSPLQLIIAREYLSRVKRKSFIITTIVVPILMIALTMAPAVVMMMSSPESRNIAVVDETGVIGARLKNTDEVRFTVVAGVPIDSLRNDDNFNAILSIGTDAIAHPANEIVLYSQGAPSLQTGSYINGQLENAIEDIRLEQYNIPNIRQILDSVHTEFDLATVRIDREEDTATSVGLAYFVGLMLDMMLYMFILIYGQMVMNSIIEEKNNRVLEIVVSSVKPAWLMLGKITGIGLVALTQILIWAVLLGMCSIWTLPLLSGIDGAAESAEMSAAISQLSDGGFIASLFIYLMLFFIGGYLFYSSIYAAIGSAVDNIQDASQLSTIATMPVIIGIISSMAVISNPGSTLAFWVSIIPFTSPMAMMSRLPYGVPTWEIVLSLVILYISFAFLIWLCAKIYRVGIFMYGKKPTFVEIIRWARYK